MSRQQQWQSDGFISKGHKKPLAQHPLLEHKIDSSGWVKYRFSPDTLTNTFYSKSPNNTLSASVVMGSYYFPPFIQRTLRETRRKLCLPAKFYCDSLGDRTLMWKITHKALITSDQSFHICGLVDLYSWIISPTTPSIPTGYKQELLWLPSLRGGTKRLIRLKIKLVTQVCQTV